MVGKRRPKRDAGALGRALKNDKFGSRGQVTANGRYVALHTTDMDPKALKAKQMQSITQMTEFEEFYYKADLAEKEFAAEKQNAVVLTNTSFQTNFDEPSEEQIQQEKEHWNSLTIPRRPAWDKNTTSEELHAKEQQSFLEWRRGLVLLEENKHLLLTPFEKNLEVWKQLWRVCERCDVIVQIVDARNPLLFRCPDLEKYVKELSPQKQNLLLVNKADLLTEEQRLAWGQFFKENNLEYIYFSANIEKIKMEATIAKRNEMMKKEPISEFEELELHERLLAAKLKQSQKSEESDEEREESEEESEENEEGSDGEEESSNLENESEDNENQEPQNPLTKIYTREQLLEFLKDNYKPMGDVDKRIQVGMVGYPNVGKSSTINVLAGEKKVAVAATPGKTKHFQTINLDEQICLCDCPGLVFPTFLSTKADMVCNGLLSIHQLQAHIPPATLVCKRIPKKVLEQVYGIVLPQPGEYEDPNRPPTAEEFLQAYAYNRGWMTVHGLPNESIAARVVLKDYVLGRLCYVYPPPNVDKTEWKSLGTYEVLETEEPIAPTNQTTVAVEKGPQDRGKTKKQKKAQRKHTEPTMRPQKIENPYELEAANMLAHTKGKFAQTGYVRTAFKHSVTPVSKSKVKPVVFAKIEQSTPNPT